MNANAVVDAACVFSRHALAYLGGNIASSEGFDWFYVSDADRQSQLRISITNSAYGEPWVWRFRDVGNWWSQFYHDHPGGVRDVSPTALVPSSKPI